MPAPSAYTESTLADFMLDELGGTASALGWAFGAPQLMRAVYAVERLLGVSDVASVTDMAALEVLARLAIWRAAKAGLADRYRVSTDGQAIDRQQHFDHAALMVAEYEQQASAIGAGGIGVVSIHPITYSEDPWALAAASGAEF